MENNDVLPKLKYYEELKNCGCECDFEHFFETERNSYRWVFQDINDHRNFEPIYTNLDRLKADTKQNKLTYKGFALSMFISCDRAKRRLSEIITGKPNLYKKLGDHISEGLLKQTDGVSDQADEIGHFDHFEYKSIELASKFAIIDKVEVAS